jgi:hypothetical protein
MSDDLPVECTEVHYICETCCPPAKKGRKRVTLVSYHRDAQRHNTCGWCGGPVQRTGLEKQIRGAEVITYQDGVEVSREPRKN